MTELGLDYLRNQEQRRSNLANERETNRANLAKEAETSRANLAKEAENLRHNTATEQQARNELAETNRHNVRTESLEDIKNRATKEHYERQDANEAARNQATKEHYERQDANQLTVADIQANTTLKREEMSNASKERINANDNQTKRMTELTKHLPKTAQMAVAKAYAAEDPVFQKQYAKFQQATGVAKEKAKEILVAIAMDIAFPGQRQMHNAIKRKFGGR